MDKKLKTLTYLIQHSFMMMRRLQRIIFQHKITDYMEEYYKYTTGLILFENG